MCCVELCSQNANTLAFLRYAWLKFKKGNFLNNQTMPPPMNFLLKFTNRWTVIRRAFQAFKTFLSSLYLLVARHHFFVPLSTSKNNLLLSILQFWPKCRRLQSMSTLFHSLELDILHERPLKNSLKFNTHPTANLHTC